MAKRKHSEVSGLGSPPHDEVALAKPASKEKRKKTHTKQHAEAQVSNVARGAAQGGTELEVAEQEFVEAPPAPKLAVPHGQQHKQQQQQAPQNNLPDQPPGKPAPVLPWMRVPIAIEASEGILLEEVHGLDPRLKAGLEGTGVEVLFPVQTVVWQETAGGSSTQHDICISAPTGSGKTLSYALPVLQALSRSVAPGLRALIVLPTRDLALQVYQVLMPLCPALGLTACVACGKASLAAEAELLSAAAVDILLATPGRLISHLEGTPGLDLSCLSFLVIDETDRLLRQAYQDWLPKLLAAAGLPAAVETALAGGTDAARSSSGSGSLLQGAPSGLGTGGRAHGASSSGLEGSRGSSDWLGGSSGSRRRLVKFVVSATLTRDPSKLERLGLHCPRYIATSAVDHRYKLPRGLVERKLVVPAENKPLALAALLRELQGEATIVFTSSVEATRRLCHLLQALHCLPDRVVEYSSQLRPEARQGALDDFRSGAAKVLVCSDAMTRGMDVEGVANVINYDAPVYVKTYVHRAGRTARAGRSGRVFTLLRHEDVKHFKGMLRKADNTFVSDHKLARDMLEALRPEVDQALQEMQEWMTSSGAGQLDGQTADAVQPSEQRQGRQDKAVRKTAYKRRRLTGIMEFSATAVA
ncbi:hypothetical protein N2152v2_002279 [Parachlorella kessleri]